MSKVYSKEVYSWGRLQKSACQVVSQQDRTLLTNASMKGKLLPYGLGRSYGDSCTNTEGVLVEPFGRFISFDREEGVLCAEAGASLDEILKVTVPAGWFLPTTPGTKFITLGGAIANDVHGKNHHKAGTFGNGVVKFTLLRSDGSVRTCSREENEEWFRATVGGLGLTGLIMEVTIQLQKIENSFLEVESIPFANVGEFFELSEKFDSEFEHTVSWIDCLAKGDSLGRGIYMGGNYSQDPTLALSVHGAPKISLPCAAPDVLLSPLNIKLFNNFYYAAQKLTSGKKIVHYDPYFYPLDKLSGWNQLYGKRGFYQYQSVIPHESAQEATKAMLEEIATSQQGSFLAVLKTFGSKESEGLLSFCRPGVTLALDFANQGEKTLALFTRLDAIVKEAGGILYPAKDARMTAEDFKMYYPELENFSNYVDPRFSSDFWKRCNP